MDNEISYENRRSENKRNRSCPHQLLYIVLDTDEGGEPDQTIFIAKRSMDVMRFVCNGIKSREFTYNREIHTKHPPIQAQHFLDDWEEFKRDRKQLNNYLGGCFLDTCFAGHRYLSPKRRNDDFLLSEERNEVAIGVEGDEDI